MAPHSTNLMDFGTYFDGIQQPTTSIGESCYTSNYSIIHSKTHELIQTTDLETLRSDNIDSGPLVLETLGIFEWSNLYQLVEETMWKQWIGLFDKDLEEC